MKRFFERSFILGIVTTLMMVTIISIWNGTWVAGWHEKTILATLTIVPLTFMLAFLLKENVTLPLVIKLHDVLPAWFSRLIPRRHSMAVFIVTGNVSIMSFYGLYMSHRYDTHHLIHSYFIQWAHTLLFAIPLLLFVVRPLVNGVFDLVWHQEDAA
ncbi:MAG: hypothetical protein ACLS66_10110 [Weissella confusa]